MLPQVTGLEYVDMGNCQEIGFIACYWVLSLCETLQCINFNPCNPVADVEDWEMLFQHFYKIHFGHSFRCCLPNYGNYIRVPSANESEIESGDESNNEE